MTDVPAVQWGATQGFEAEEWCDSTFNCIFLLKIDQGTTVDMGKPSERPWQSFRGEVTVSWSREGILVVERRYPILDIFRRESEMDLLIIRRRVGE